MTEPVQSTGRTPKIFVVAIASLALANCGDDNGGGSGTGNINQTQAVGVSTAVNTAFSSVLPSAFVGKLGFPQAVQTTNNVTATCTGGGTVAVNGTWNLTTDSKYDYDFDYSFNNCATVSGDTTYTVNGDIGFKGAYEFSGLNRFVVSADSIRSVNAVSVKYHYAALGTIDALGGQVDVTDCTYDVSWNYDGSTATPTFTYNGRICGQEFNYSTN
jgi:hypothetical protein